MEEIEKNVVAWVALLFLWLVMTIAAVELNSRCIYFAATMILIFGIPLVALAIRKETYWLRTFKKSKDIGQ